VAGQVTIAGLLQLDEDLIQGVQKLGGEQLALGFQQLPGTIRVWGTQKLIDEPDFGWKPVLHQAYNHIG
jgi:hypothetical protein